MGQRSAPRASGQVEPPTEQAPFAAVVEGRRSVRRFLAQPVPEESIREALELAIQAPSAHNSQPWRFAVLSQAEQRLRLSDAMGRAFARDLVADGKTQAEVEVVVGRAKGRVREAPCAILLCLSLRDADHYGDERRDQAEFLMGVQGAALAAGTLLLALHAQGLAACWTCGPLFCPEVARQALGLPGDWHPQALILVGKPAQARGPRKLLALDEVTLWR